MWGALDIDLLLVVEFIPTESRKFKGIPFCLVHALHVSRQTQAGKDALITCAQKRLFIRSYGGSSFCRVPPTDLQCLKL